SNGLPIISDERSLILREVVRVLRSDMDLRNVFAEIGQIVGQFIPYEAMGVGLVTESGRQIRSYVRLLPGGQLCMEDHPERGIGECSLDIPVLEKNRPVLIADFFQEGDPTKAFDRYIMERGSRSVIAVPVPGKDRVTGIFWICNTQPNQFHAAHVEVSAA